MTDIRTTGSTSEPHLVRTLVVSDLHLHAGSPPEDAAALARLLDQPAQRIILNGDLLDLDRVAGERKAGEGPAAAQARLVSILRRFPEVPQALRAFAARGGQIVWLPGNHDAELAHPAVQEALRGELKLPGAALRFDQTFDDGTLVAEHGHQQDPDNAFFPSTAAAVTHGRLAAFPLGCLMTRFLLCRLPGYQNRADNYRTPLGVLWRVIKDFGLRVPRMVALYVAAGLRITAQAFRGKRAGVAAASLASPWRVIRRLYLDRVALTLTLGVVLLVAAVVPHGSAVALWAGVPLAALLLVPPVRARRFRHRDRAAAREAACAWLERGRQLVVLGHTHHAEELSHASGRYLNPGPFELQTGAGRPFVIVEGTQARLDWLPASR